MKELQIFNNEKFGEVRTILINGEPWFVTKDIADVLDYSDADRIIKRLDDDQYMILTQDAELANFDIPARGFSIINESGLYDAIIGSTKEEAKPFRRWVFNEILPTIRKTGAYLSDEYKIRMLSLEEENARLKKSQFLLENMSTSKYNEMEKMKNAEINTLKAEVRSLSNSLRTDEPKQTFAMPSRQVTKDINAFMQQFSKDKKDGLVECDEFYDIYCRSRKRDLNLPNIIQFEEIVFNKYNKVNVNGVRYWQHMAIIAEPRWK